MGERKGTFVSNFGDDARSMSGESSTNPKPAIVLHRDYDKVLGISLCLLVQRIIGKTHTGKVGASGGENRFTYKIALLEELDNFQTHLAMETAEEEQSSNGVTRDVLHSSMESEHLEVKDRPHSNEGRTRNDQLENCFFYFDAALRYLINPEQYFTEITSEKHFKPHDAESNFHPTVVLREEKVKKLKSQWQARRVQMRKEGNGKLELHQMFWEAAQAAYKVFNSLINEWRMYESVVGISTVDVPDSFRVFKNLLVSTKILVACAYFREFENEELNISRVYVARTRDDNEILSLGTQGIVKNLMLTPQVVGSKRLVVAVQNQSRAHKGVLSQFSGSFIVRKKQKNKKIVDIPFPFGAILQLSLVIDKIVAKYKKGDDYTGQFYREFEMHRYPSVFQKKVFHPAFKKTEEIARSVSQNTESVSSTALLDKKMFDVIAKRNQSRKFKNRLAIITEDSDSCVLTVTDSNLVSIVEAASLKIEDASMKPLANVEVLSAESSLQPRVEITTVASNREWLVFGTADGQVLVYNIDPSSLSEASNKLCKIPFLETARTQFRWAHKITAMFLTSSDSRLFIGDSRGMINEFCVTEESREPESFKTGSEVDLQAVSYLASDERTTLTTRYPCKLVFSGHADGKVFIWNVLLGHEKNRLIFQLSPHQKLITAMAFKDKTLATAGKDKCVKFWEVTITPTALTVSQTPLKTHVFEDDVGAIVIDYEVVIVSVKSSINFYSLNGFELVERLFLGDDVVIASMAIDRRRRLYTADEEVRIWDIEGLLETTTLKNKPKKSEFLRPRKDSKKYELRLDTGLMTILSDPFLRRHFEKYLVDHLCDEGLRFLILVEKYEYFAETVSGTALYKYGREIIEEHVCENSPRTINIGGNIRVQFENLKEGEFGPNTFDVLKNETISLIVRNHLLNFIQEFNENIVPELSNNSLRVQEV